MKLSMEWLQNQTARKYLKSYLTISIIPVLVLFVVGCFAVGIMGNRRAEQSMQAELELLKNDLDASITFMESSTSHLSGMLSGGREQIAEEEQLLQQIRVYQESCQLPCTVLYYPREGNWIYASDEVMGYERFQQSGGWRDELDMIQFYIKLNTVQRRTLLTTCPISGDKTGSYLAYLSPVPSLAASPSGTLAFLVNRQYFDDMVKKD